MTRTSNQVRFIVDTFPIRRWPEISPSGLSLTNLTGTTTDIAYVEPPEEAVAGGYAPAGMAAINPALDTVLRIDFDNWHATERALTGNLIFRVHVAQSTNEEAYPLITTVIRRGGVDLATMTAVRVERAAHGFIYHYSHSSAGFTTQTIGLRITGTTTGTEVPVPIGVGLIAEQTGYAYDSAWLDLDGSVARVIPDVTIASGSPVHWLAEFSDFHDVSQVLVGYPYSPFGFIGVASYAPLATGMTVGRFVGASTLTLTPSSSDGRDFWNVRPVHGSQRARRRGGAMRTGRAVPVYKEAETRGVFKLESEAMDSLLHNFYDVVGPNVPVLVMPHADRPQDDIWAVIERFDLKQVGVAAGADGTGRRYDLDASFMEYVAKIAGR